MTDTRPADESPADAIMTPDALHLWKNSAMHGESVTYYIGVRAMGETCALAMKMSDLGEVSLVQRRRPDSGLDYMAQRIIRDRRR